MRLSRNGQQFEALGVNTFGYRAPPTISAFVPRAGAVWGGTIVAVHGANLRPRGDAYAPYPDELYRCAFGDALVPAVYNASEDTALCTSPPRVGPSSTQLSNASVVSLGPHAVTINASIVLNGVEAGGHINGGAATAFEYVNATADQIFPVFGPTSGGSLVAIHGNGLHHGHDRLCRFGLAITPATLSSDGLALRCTAPPASNAGAHHGGVIDIAISLNGQDFDFIRPLLQFSYYMPPVISAIDPPAGPSSGRTALTLSGTGFGGASPLLRCRFGSEVIVAEGGASDNEAICRTPPAHRAQAGATLSSDQCLLAPRRCLALDEFRPRVEVGKKGR